MKLNWNEGLEGPFPGVEEAVAAELERAWIYPAEAYTDLRESVAGLARARRPSGSSRATGSRR